jgi:site-specific recombinase XerD
MRNTFTIIFYPRRSKTNRNGEHPIYARVTINGRRLELATKRWTIDEKWDSNSGRAKGKTESAEVINAHLESFRNNIYDHYRTIIDKGLPVTTESLKSSIHGTTQAKKTIVAVFEKHNQQAKSRIGHEFAEGTVERYETTLQHLRQFMRTRYRLSDMPVAQIDNSFINEFEYFLKNTRECGHNTAVKYIKNFKKIVRICMANGWLIQDPFLNYKSKLRSVERDYLTWEELQAIEQKKFEISRLDLVRDIFVFSCYTGLAYIDAAKLTNDNLVTAEDGELWIHTFRTKTHNRANILLLPKAIEILNKYEDHPVNNESNRLLPIFSNQRMNAYLKEIADFCGIKKTLTYHVARHTFATTVTLTKGVPLESVSAMLGHTSIRSTQIYARILKVKVGDDMKALKQKLNSCA